MFLGKTKLENVIILRLRTINNSFIAVNATNLFATQCGAIGYRMPQHL